MAFSTERLPQRADGSLSGVGIGMADDLRRIGAGINSGQGSASVQQIAFERLLGHLRGSVPGGTVVGRVGSELHPGMTFTEAFDRHLRQKSWSAFEVAARGLVSADGAQSDMGETLALAGLQAGLDAGIETWREHDPFGLAHLELSYQFSGQGRPSWQAMAVKPLFEDEITGQAAFSQLSLTRENDATTYNAGLAYRALTPDRQWLIGPNAFFDYTTKRSHTRASIGFDAKSERFGLSANRYFRLKDWKDSRFGYEERALSGYDIELSGRLPGLPNVELFARQYLWWQTEDANIKGREYAIEYSPVPLLRTRLALIDPQGERRYAEASGQVRYRFGVPLKDQLRTDAMAENSVFDRRFEKVRRENTIRTQERLKAEVRGTVIETVGANTIVRDGMTTALTLNAPVSPPATITVADTVGAIARILFGDGAILTIGQDSTVTLDVGTLTLVTGIMQYVSGSGVPHVIAVPGGTISLLGTDVDVRVAGGTTTARVRDGAIRVEGGGGVQTANPRQMLALGGGAPAFVPDDAALYRTHTDEASEKLDRAGQPRQDPKVAPYPTAEPSRVTAATTVGEPVTFALSFSKPVQATGTPLLVVTINGATRTAPLSGGAGTDTLAFTLTLQPAEAGATTALVTGIDLNGGDIAGGGLSAVITFKSVEVELTTDGTPIIPDDTDPPSGYSVAWTTDPVNAGNAAAGAFEITSAEVGASYSYTITSSGGGAPVTGTGTIASADQAVSGIDVSSLPDGTLTVSVTLTDTAGNAGVAATDTVIKNTGLPTVTVATAESSLTNASPIVFSIVFSEAMTGNALMVGELTVTNGTAANLTTADSITYSVEITPSADGAVSVQVPAGVAQSATFNPNAASNMASVTYDGTAPAGYSVAWTTNPVNAGNQTAAGFQLAAAEIGAGYSYSITSSGGGAPVTGTGTIASADQAFTGIDVSSLPDGTLTVSMTLTDTVGNAGVAVSDTVTKEIVIDCTDLGALASAMPGTACSDGSIYAGSLSGTYLITHVSGCGHEPGGNALTKASALFTPTCTGAVDSMLKHWSNSTGANEGATSFTDGLANTNQLLADAQRQNPAAAYCYYMDLNGHTDWYLPARDELNVLYINRIAIGGFASAFYWSSLEGSSNGARGQNFGNGGQIGTIKHHPNRVRCVRRAN